MTRLPADSRDVRGQRFSTSQIWEEVCAHPTCDVSGRENLELHELWPRSFLRGQPIEGVKLWDGTIVGNQVYLCNPFQNGHHQLITENKAWIRWFGMAFWWVENGEGFKLSYQPEIHRSYSKPLGTPDEPTPYPTPGNAGETLTTPPVSIGSQLDDYDLAGVRMDGTPGPVVVHGGKTFHLHTPKEGEECPTCKRKVPPKKKREPAKRRGTITFRVPKDNEDGAEIVDNLLDQIREARGREDHKGWKYYVLVECLVFVVQNLHMVAQDD